MTAKTSAKGHTAKHAATRKHAAGRKHAPVKQAKPVTGKLQPVHTVGTPAGPAKPRGFGVGDVLPVCAFEAVAMSLRLAGQRVSDDDVAGLWELVGRREVSIAEALERLPAIADGLLTGFTRLTTPPWQGFEPRLPSSEEGVLPASSLILGVDLPGPHAVLATPDGWWSWGELHDPWPCRIEEAWAVTWA